ncbi:MAG TPA: hypothetical protein VF553_00600 [Pyrinomonadaceae bacterium]|jgi:hypothetical protein
MSTETDKYETEIEREPRHSAFEEFSRDERRPAVMLLSALLLSALFFAIGIMVGRWTVEPLSQTGAASSAPTPPPTPSNPGPSPQTASVPSASPGPTTDNKQRRYSLLIPDIRTSEAARTLVESLERAGYRDVRTQPRTPVLDSPFNVLVGHYTRAEAEVEAARLRGKGGPRTKNVRVIEEPAG